VLETITFGYRSMKIEPTVAAIAIAEAEKDRPSWSVIARRAAKHAAMTARISTGWGTSGPPATLRVQITQPTTSTIAAQPSGRASARARSRTWSVVLSLRNVAPCRRHSATKVTPVNKP
jgi:hypothetical protein